jgi:hypothetical protein
MLQFEFSLILEGAVSYVGHRRSADVRQLEAQITYAVVCTAATAKGFDKLEQSS